MRLVTRQSENIGPHHWHLTRRQFLRALLAPQCAIGISALGGCRSVATTTPSPAPPIPPSPTTSATRTAGAIATTATRAPERASLSPEAAAYLATALDWIQANALLRDRVSWPTARLQADLLAESARTPAETYRAIRFVLQQLGDRHSGFYEPTRAAQSLGGQRRDFGFFADDTTVSEVFPAGPAATTVQVGDRIETIAGQPADSVALNFPTITTPVELTLWRADGSATAITLAPMTYDGNREPVARRIERRIGYIEISAFSGQGAIADRHATMIQAQIRALDEGRSEPIGGWIVDLRRNRGGNSFAMLAGLGPLLDNGLLGTLVDATGRMVTTWSYKDGRALLGDRVVVRAASPSYRLQREGPPIALLQERQTASAGELTITAFRGRPSVRTFGGYTSGVPTVNSIKELSDGAWINLTTACMADRTGQIATGSLRPDETATTTWATFGGPDDLTIQAATAWLRQ